MMVSHRDCVRRGVIEASGGMRRGRRDEMVGWHHQLNGHEFEQILGDSEGQVSLACESQT